MLPEASLVFLDELLNANSAILNSLLMVLNERVFRRGRETRLLPLLMVVSASNRLPEDDALGALFDRFLLRVRCDNVAPGAAQRRAGGRLEARSAPGRGGRGIRYRRHPPLESHAGRCRSGQVRTAYVELVHRLRHAGIPISDRRAVKLQRLLAASALLCGRLTVNATDLWVLRYIWDTEEQQEVLASIVQDAIDRSGDRARGEPSPRPRRRRTRSGMPGKRFAAYCPAGGRGDLPRHGEELPERSSWLVGGPLPMGQRPAAARVPGEAGRVLGNRWDGSTHGMRMWLRSMNREHRLGHSPRSPRRGGRRPLAAGRGRRGLRRLGCRLASRSAIRRRVAMAAGRSGRGTAVLGPRRRTIAAAAARGCRRGGFPKGRGPRCCGGWACELPPGRACRPERGDGCRWPWSARTAWKRLRSCSRGSTSGRPMRSRPRKSDSTAGDLPSRPTAAWRYTASTALLPCRLPGQRWVEREGIAVPAGWTWTPAVEAGACAAGLRACRGRRGIMACGWSWERIAGDAVRARDAGRGQGDGEELQS